MRQGWGRVCGEGVPQKRACKTLLGKVNKRIAPGTGLEVKPEEQVEAAEGEEGCLNGKRPGGCLLAKAGWRAISGKSWQVKYFHVQGNDLDFFSPFPRGQPREVQQPVSE